MELPDWVKRWKRKGIAFLKKGERYYAYKITSKWDKRKRRPVKITQAYLGVVTQRGIIKLREEPKRYGVYEYGSPKLLFEISKDILELLNSHFPGIGEAVYSFAVVRLLYKSTLKLAKALVEKTVLPLIFPELKISSKTLSSYLASIGGEHSKRIKFMESLIDRGEQLALDMTFLFSSSENIKWLEYGYNAEDEYKKQLGMLLLFSLSKEEPTYIRILPGSIRDVKSLVNAILELKLGKKRVILVTDKGFYSRQNLRLLDSKAIGYVIPLRRNLKIIKYPKEYKNFFKFRERYIRFFSYKLGNKRVFVYLDQRLRVEEDETFLSLMEAGKKNFKEYEKARHLFGTIALITNCELSGEEAYSMYKQKSDIEQCVDVYRNLLNADRLYLRSEEHVIGYSFVNLLSLILYYRVLSVLRKKGLVGKLSVNDLLTYLSKIYLVEDIEGNKYIASIPSKVEKVVEAIGFKDLLLKTMDI